MRPKLSIFLILALALCADLAFGASGMNAAKAPMGEWIDSGNRANDLLCMTIGDPGGTGLFGCHGAETRLFPVFKVFAVAVMSIAALFMLWNVVAGAMASAQDGSFLGKKTSGTWAPLRVTMGWAMLIPAFGGFNLAQLIMVWATAIGVGIGGAAASGAADLLPASSNIYSVPTSLLKAEDMAVSLREKTICVARWIKETENLRGSLDTEAASVQWGYTVRDTTTPEGLPALLLVYGALNREAGYRADECGTVRVPLPAPKFYNDAGTATILTAVSGAIRSAIPRLAAVFLEEYQLIAKGEITDKATSLASKQRMLAAMDAFDAALLEAAKSATAAANAQAQKTSVGKGDWLALGFRDVRGSVASWAASKGVATQPEGSPAYREAPRDTSTSWGDVYGEKTAMEQIGDLFSTSKETGSRATKDEDTAKAQASIASLPDLLNNGLNEKVDDLGKSVAKGFDGLSSASGGSPLKMLVALGVKISAWAAGMIMWFLAIATALVLLSFPFPGIGGVITFIGCILLGLAVPLLFFGMRLAAVLPFLTAMIWCGAILNWLVIVVEALFGAPLWALAHLDMEGDGMNMQRTGHGYIFLLNLLFRPVMLVGAIVFADLAMKAVFGLFLDFVSGMLNNLAARSNDWWGNLMMIIGGIWVIVIFAEYAVTQCLGLVFQIPDKVFTWVGGQFGSNVGADLERNVGGKVDRGIDAAGGVGREATRALSQASKRSPGGSAGGGQAGGVRNGSSGTAPRNPGGGGMAQDTASGGVTKAPSRPPRG